jgi:GntR family transcriptional regulator/MocR family aminotransferase
MQIPLDLDGRGPVPLQRQLFDRVRDAILSGRLAPGQRMPSSRELCAQLAVSRNTVALAYERLLAEGYIESRRGVGTFVSPVLPEEALRSRREALATADRADRRTAPRYAGPFSGRPPTLFGTATQSLTCDFRVGRPAPDSFPLKAWRRIALRVLGRSDPALIQYGDPAGLPRLRAAIARHVAAARGIRIEPAQVIIVAGVQEALNLVARVFLTKGSRVAVESPTYQGAAYCFESFGAKLVPIPIDAAGLVVERLPRHAPRLAYVTPSHQFPLGYTLSLERRLQLLDRAVRAGLYIVEDDYDGDFRYQGSPLTALQGLDVAERVLYTTTFSKSIGAGLRLGYLIVPAHLVEAFNTVKALLNNGHPWLDQMIVAELIDSGEFENHLRRIRMVYMARRDCLLDALERHFGPCRISGHEGGMHLAWHLPDALPGAASLQRLAAGAGVGIYDLSSGHAVVFDDRSDLDRIVLLGYSSVGEPRIRGAIRDLAATIARGRSHV